MGHVLEAVPRSPLFYFSGLGLFRSCADIVELHLGLWRSLRHGHRQYGGPFLKRSSAPSMARR
jgi:hypothetical protein